MSRQVLWIDDEALGGLEPLAVKASLAEDFRLLIATSASQAEEMLARNDLAALVFDICLDHGSPKEPSERRLDQSGLRLLKKYLSPEFTVDGPWRKVPASRIGVMTVIVDPGAHREIVELGVEAIVVKSTRLNSNALVKLIHALLAHDAAPPS